MLSTSENRFLPFCRRNPSFLLLWLGQCLSQSGNRMYQIALLWWLVSNGGDAAGREVGIYMGVVALPSLLFVKWIGKFVDCASSRALLVGCDWGAALVLSLAALWVIQGGAIVGLYGLVFVASLLQAVLDPTLNKSVSQVVQPDDLDRGVSLIASTQSLANFGGAVVGAALVGKLGLIGVIAVAVVGYGVSGLASRFVKFRASASQASLQPLKTETAWTWLRSQPLLRKVLFGFGAINFFATPTLVVLPIYLKRELSGSASELALLEGALWLGMISGTLTAGKIASGVSALRAGAICLFLFGLSLAVPSVFVHFGAYAISLCLAGYFLGVNNVKFLTLFQERVPLEWKGRFFATMQALISLTFPIAYVLFGIASDAIAPHWLCAIQGLGVMTLSVLYFRWSLQEEASCTHAMELTTA